MDLTMKNKKYVYSTLGYGLFAFFGLILVVYSFFTKRYVGLVIGILIMYVALDNFFCGCRARRYEVKDRGHYVIPRFLKRK